MKLLVKMILPVAAFALASAGAVNTKADKDAAASKVSTIEWIQNPDQDHCLQRTVDCTTQNTGSLCMADSDTNQVFRKNAAGKCNVTLYKISR